MRFDLLASHTRGVSQPTLNLQLNEGGPPSILDFNLQCCESLVNV